MNALVAYELLLNGATLQYLSGQLLVNGSGIASSGGGGGVTGPVVFQTGDQSISGVKKFYNEILAVSGISGDGSQLSNLTLAPETSGAVYKSALYSLTSTTFCQIITVPSGYGLAVDSVECIMMNTNTMTGSYLSGWFGPNNSSPTQGFTPEFNLVTGSGISRGDRFIWDTPLNVIFGEDYGASIALGVYIPQHAVVSTGHLSGTFTLKGTLFKG